MQGTLPWYVARSSGLVAWALLAGAVVWGLLMTSKLVRQWIKNSWLLDLHRWLGGLALIFTGVHIVAILGDSYVHFGLASVLVPFAAHWHPVAVAWGVASLYLLAAVELTSLARRRLPNRLWRRVHVLSFPLFLTSTIHGLSSGTDARAHLAIITALLTVTAVAILIALRIDAKNTRPTAPPRRTPRPAPAPQPAPARVEPPVLVG